ncbi:MAG: TerD family protein [Alphaproteobacteria bacterium]|nr:TerD family protein [Alphaproteobacteria bacterium]
MLLALLRKTLRVPLPPEPRPGDGAPLARQLDVALLQVGFKLSADLMVALSELHPEQLQPLGEALLAAVKELVGDHHAHNTYFKGFPDEVPDTFEFWWRCVLDALADPEAADAVQAGLAAGSVNLLSLPMYGRTLHSYEELQAAHAAFMPSAKDRLTVLHLGGTLAQERAALYLQLAASPVPLNATDRALLAELAARCLDEAQPERIPVRESRALINQARVQADRAPRVDTVTDVLRLACALSGGDETLVEKTRFRSLPRRQRRLLLRALEEVVAASPAKLADVGRHREPWKRLGERLHPAEHPELPHAWEVFAVARGDQRVRTLAGRVELALEAGDVDGALDLLIRSPGTLFRSADRLLRLANREQRARLEEALTANVGGVSGRVLMQLRQHLDNAEAADWRVFVNSRGRAWAAKDGRGELDDGGLYERLAQRIDEELARRMPHPAHLVVEAEAMDLALPLSQKTLAGGFGVLPRGSVSPVNGELLRFFIYWKQAAKRTDLDLSCDMLDANLRSVGQLSWTALAATGGAHSGDITEAPEGAFEAIELDLNRLDDRVRYLVPTVYLFSGEPFTELSESSFGFMQLQRGQQGLPFEPRTVRLKSDLRGAGRNALPLAFERGDDGWRARWLHLFMLGSPRFNTVEASRVSVTLLVRAMLQRRFLDVRYAVGRMAPGRLSLWSKGAPLPAEPVTFIGLEAPEGLAPGSEVISLPSLSRLIPE